MQTFSQWLSARLGGTAARLVKIGGLIVLALLVAYLILTGIDKWYGWKYEKRAKALEQQIRVEHAKGKAAETRAEMLQSAIEGKYAEIRQLEGRAKAAEDLMRLTGNKVVTLKENYETIRYLPLPSTPVFCADACADLAAVGYKCQ